MQNFFELTDTKLDIVIKLIINSVDQPVQVHINNKMFKPVELDQSYTICTTVSLLDPIRIQVQPRGAYVISAEFDSWQARPHWGTETDQGWCFSTENQPFYQWKHHATGQGWLLKPQL